MSNSALEVSLIKQLLKSLENLGLEVVNSLPNFQIGDELALPYGLKPHTRSVAWIVEQVLTQRFRYEAKSLGISKVKDDWPDTSLHDLSFDFEGNTYFVNIKTHQSTGRQSKNDISAVEKLYRAYVEDPTYNLLYAAFGIEINQLARQIHFVENEILCFSPQFLPIYVNPRNDKIQAFYRHTPIERSRENFLAELVANSKSILL